MYGQIALNAIIFGIHGKVTKSLVGVDAMRSEMIAGATAGFVESFIVSPVELVKIRMQLQGEGEGFVKNKCYKNQHYGYSSSIDCLKKIYRYENGIRGIYRGLGSTLIREVPAFTIYFGSYYYLCDKLGAVKDGKVNILKLLLCGGTAGILSWVLSYPQDVIKTRMQADGMGKTAYNGIIHCGKRIYKEEGFKAYFRGLNATIIRAFPTNGATLATVTLCLRFVESQK